MDGIGRQSVPIRLIVHCPETEAGRRQLAERIAGIHAEMASRFVQKLDCPSGQKAELLDAAIAAAKKEAGAQTP